MKSFEDLLGIHVENLSAYQMCCRAVVVFFVALIYIRIAGIRIFGKQSAFDNFTSLMLGAIMGRACVDDPSFYGSLLAALVIMILHRLIALLTFHSRKAGTVFKGTHLLLWRNGQLHEKNLRSAYITEKDIQEALRKNLHLNSMENINEVYLERSGEISFIVKGSGQSTMGNR